MMGIECCDALHQTRYCPDCGKQLDNHSAHTLLVHCESRLASVKSLKKGIVESLEELRAGGNEKIVARRERRAFKADILISKWQSWVTVLKGLIQKDDSC